MIKFACRRNLIYPLQLLIWNTLRDAENILVKHFFDFKNSEISALLMFLGEFIAGLIFYLYNKKFLGKENQIRSSIFNLGINKAKKGSAKDGQLKIFFLIFNAALFDLIQFSLFLHYDKFINISDSLEQRFRGIFTIYLALFYYYVLKFPIYRHQKFSLIVIGVCIFIIIITEFIFQEFNIFLTHSQFIIALILIFIILCISSLGQIIEKYLIEIDKLSPFYILMIEGIFGLILSTLSIISYETSEHIVKVHKNLSNLQFFLLILCFFLYVILSGGKNLFRLVTIKIYSPMTSTFMNYILNPFYIIYYFIFRNDFLYNGERSYTYFIINFIITLVITFFGFVYNEFVILFFSGLERDTYNQVTLRAFDEFELDSLNNIQNEEEHEEEEDDKEEESGLFRYTKMELK